MALRVAKSWLATLYILLVLAVFDGALATRFCQQVVEPFGYGCTEYSVQTDDGFVLVMHRLSPVDGLMGKGHKDASPPPVGSINTVVGKSQVQNRGAIDPRSDPAHSTPKENGTSSRIPSSNVGTTQEDTSSVPAHPAYPHAPAPVGSSDTDSLPYPTSASDETSTEEVRPSISSGPTSTSEDLSSVQPSIRAGPAPTPSPSHNASGSSIPRQSVNGSSPSNFTASPEAGKGSPVLLMHTEFLNGDSWFQYVEADQRATRLLPQMLLEDGFDVWIGHQRATYWGHGHSQLEPTDRAYWNWTWDQLVEYDLPAQLRFISTETNQPVHFIGASQAATVGAAAATNKETAQMIRSLTLIGPAAYRGNTSSFLLNAWAYFFGVTLDTTYYTTGFQNGAFNFTSEFPQTRSISGQGLSGLTLGLISGPNCCLGSTSIQMTNGWDGTTPFKNLLHWQQGIRHDTFQRYDYGTAANNFREYGQPAPPAYDVSQIPSRLPILIIGGGRDWVAPPQGTNTLISQMQKPATLLNLTNYAHYDLYFSVRRETDVYLPIIQFLVGPDFK